MKIVVNNKKRMIIIVLTIAIVTISLLVGCVFYQRLKPNYFRYKDFSLKIPEEFEPELISESENSAFYIDHDTKALISISYENTYLNNEAIAEDLREQLTSAYLEQHIKFTELYDITTTKLNRVFWRRILDKNGEYTEAFGVFRIKGNDVYVIKINMPIESCDESIRKAIIDELRKK